VRRPRIGGSLVAGLTFLAIGAVLLLHALDAFDLPAGVVPAALLIGLGLALLARRP
jgi:hypothetical protein